MGLISGFLKVDKLRIAPEMQFCNGSLAIL